MLKQRMTGFTLMEALVALLITTVGLLGVAGLLIRGQQFNIVSGQRSQGTFLAADLLERIRINSDGTSGNGNADDGAYAVSSFSNEKYPTAKSCDDQACTTGELAKYDLNHFFNMVKNNFPNGEARIKWDSANRSYEVIIRWMNVVSSDDACDEDGETLANKECQAWVVTL